MSERRARGGPGRHDWTTPPAVPSAPPPPRVERPREQPGHLTARDRRPRAERPEPVARRDARGAQPLGGTGVDARVRVVEAPHALGQRDVERPLHPHEERRELAARHRGAGRERGRGRPARHLGVGDDGDRLACLGGQRRRVGEAGVGRVDGDAGVAQQAREQQRRLRARHGALRRVGARRGAAGQAPPRDAVDVGLEHGRRSVGEAVLGHAVRRAGERAAAQRGDDVGSGAKSTWWPYLLPRTEDSSRVSPVATSRTRGTCSVHDAPPNSVETATCAESGDHDGVPRKDDGNGTSRTVAPVPASTTAAGRARRRRRAGRSATTPGAHRRSAPAGRPDR